MTESAHLEDGRGKVVIVHRLVVIVRLAPLKARGRALVLVKLRQESHRAAVRTDAS